MSAAATVNCPNRIRITLSPGWLTHGSWSPSQETVRRDSVGTLVGCWHKGPLGDDAARLVGFLLVAPVRFLRLW